MLDATVALPIAAFDPPTFGAGLFCIAFGLVLWTRWFAELIGGRGEDPVPGMFFLVPRSRLGLRIFGVVMILLGIGGLGGSFVD